MADNKLTDTEIIKALECCIGGTKCKKCPMFKECGEDIQAIEKNSLDLINRQKAEIEKKDIEIDILIRKKNDAYDEIAEQQAEIDRLKETFRKRIGREIEETYSYLIEEIKAEAYKDLAEKLKAKKQRLFSEDEGMLWCVSVDDIDEFLKEVSE